MIKRVLNTIIITIIFVLLLSFGMYAEEKLRVVVVDLKADDVSPTTARTITNMIRTELVNDGKFAVIERNQMEAILKEQGFSQTGCTDEACVIQMGRMLSANKMLMGEVSGVGNNMYITVRVVDVEKGVVDFAEKVVARSNERLDEVTSELTEKLTRRIETAMRKKVSAKKQISGEMPKQSTATIETASSRYIFQGIMIHYAMFMPTATDFKQYYGIMHGGGVGYNYLINEYLRARVMGIVNTGSAKDADAKALFANCAGGVVAGYPLYDFIFPYVGITGKWIWVKESSDEKSNSFNGFGAETIGGFAFRIGRELSIYAEYIYSWGTLRDKNQTDVTSSIMQMGLCFALGW